MEKLSRAEAARMLGIKEDELANLCKEHLEYRTDYFMHPKYKTMLTTEAVGKIKEVLHPHSQVFKAKPDEVIYGIALKNQPPNPRAIWIKIPGKDHKGICNMPPRFARLYKDPGKRIPVRHVQANVYQLAIVDWRND